MTDASNAPKKISTALRTVAELQEFLKGIPSDYDLCFLLGDSSIPYPVCRVEYGYTNHEWEMLDFVIKEVVVPNDSEA